MASPRILFIDAYDSFTNNIVSLLTTLLHADVYVIRNDLTKLDNDGSEAWNESTFLSNLDKFDAVVCGPGPGSPIDDAAVGVYKLLWKLPEAQTIPVLGICLGFQSLVASFGGEIRRLNRGLHGMVRSIDHSGSLPGDIFDNVFPFEATLYHSLCADIGQDSIPDALWSGSNTKWLATASAPNLVPLAWLTEKTGQTTERILMAVRHKTKPFWGLQYHPESASSEETGHNVLQNWFQAAMEWNAEHRPRRMTLEDTVETKGPLGGLNMLQPNLLNRAMENCRLSMKPLNGYLSPLYQVLFGVPEQPLRYYYRQIPLPAGVEVPDVVEALGIGDQNTIVLDSSSAANGDLLAANSIIAVDVEKSLQIRYRVGVDELVVVSPELGPQESTSYAPEHVKDFGNHIWEVMSYYWHSRANPHCSEGAPSIFKGGWMGYVTYEWGTSRFRTGHDRSDNKSQYPDVCFAWVTRSVVVNHKDRVIYVQELQSPLDPEGWIDDTVERLQCSTAWKSKVSINDVSTRNDAAYPKTEAEDCGRLLKRRLLDQLYNNQVEECQNRIAAGDSYELCLTNQAILTKPRGDVKPRHLQEHETPVEGGHYTISPWDMYREFRKRQPAPFGSFIRLGGATFLSCSPERFLQHDGKGECKMRPMKGTVRKSETVSTVAQAEKLLHIPKEQAENLMIVDLVRHDLHGVCGAGRVSVEDLMKVEEYATVFQMSSVIKGQLPDVAPGVPDQHRYTGFDALTAALPPGSMTGAPKKRSCEILKDIEGPVHRGLYSGVVGYMDCTGAGDWSVNIRCMFRWDRDTDQLLDEFDREGNPVARDIWRIGAGGAVTALSTPEGETEEMKLKMAGPLDVFRHTA